MPDAPRSRSPQQPWRYYWTTDGSQWWKSGFQPPDSGFFGDFAMIANKTPSEKTTRTQQPLLLSRPESETISYAMNEQGQTRALL